jgi:hypothetical protein
MWDAIAETIARSAVNSKSVQTAHLALAITFASWTVILFIFYWLTLVVRFEKWKKDEVDITFPSKIRGLERMMLALRILLPLTSIFLLVFYVSEAVYAVGVVNSAFLTAQRYLTSTVPHLLMIIMMLCIIDQCIPLKGTIGTGISVSLAVIIYGLIIATSSSPNSTSLDNTISTLIIMERAMYILFVITVSFETRKFRKSASGSKDMLLQVLVLPLCPRNEV